MYLVPIAWIYVALMMAVAEATNANGTLLGAIITFVLYGVLPVSVLVYLMGAPSRRRAIKAREAQALASARNASIQPDAGSQAATSAEPDLITPVRKEP